MVVALASLAGPFDFGGGSSAPHKNLGRIRTSWGQLFSARPALTQQPERDNPDRPCSYGQMFIVLLLLCVLMVVGAGVCLIAILGMWDKPEAATKERLNH